MNQPPEAGVLPPHNSQAEAGVLGSILIDPDSIIEVAQFLRVEHFNSAVNQCVYKAVHDLFNKRQPIDSLTVIEELRRAKKMDYVGGESYIIGLVSEVPTSQNIGYYGRAVYETAVRRDLLRASFKNAELAHDEERPIDEVMSEAQSNLNELAKTAVQGDLKHVHEASVSWVDMLEKRGNRDGEIAGVPTGFTDLDALMWGLNAPDLGILAARPGMGKTAMVLCIALNATMNKENSKNIAFFNLEMSGEQLVQRAVANIQCIDQNKLLRGRLSEHEWQLVYEGVAKLQKSSLYIDDTPNASPSQIRSKLMRMQADAPVDLVIIDYLQLMRSDKKHGNRNEEVGHITRELKMICKEFNVPILALAQLSRSCESRQDKRPMPSDLRDSGEIEQNADSILFIYRDEYYNPDTTDRPNVAEVILAKYRNGETGKVDLFWDGKYSRFSDLSMEDIRL